MFGFLVKCSSFPSHGFTFQFQLVGIVYQSIQYGVSQGWISHGIVPGFHRQLAGDDTRLPVIAILNDLQKFSLFFTSHGGDEEIIQDQHLALDECVSMLRDIDVH